MPDGSASLAAQRLRAILPVDRYQRQVMSQPAASASTEAPGTRWRGASRALRSLSNWIVQAGSATADQSGAELEVLRARSRDAKRNEPIGRAALLRGRTSIVGTGLVCRPSLEPQVLGITQEEAKAYAAQLRSAFERWAGSPLECDIEGTQDFYMKSGLVLMSAWESGDCFVATPMMRRPGCVNELKLQVFEADRICNPDDRPDEPELIQGIQFRGPEPVGCWLRSTHPGDDINTGMPSWTFLPYYGEATGRRRVMHVWCDIERPGQVRGVPFLAPILEPLKQLGRYSNSELMAAVLSAMLTVFITRDAEGGTDENGDPASPLPADSAGHVALGSGAIVDLAPGEKPEVVNPGRPNANFDPFFVATVKQIGAALEIPLDVLLLQFDSSYSAARAAMLEAWRMFVTRRWWLTQQFCQPCYELLIDEEVASGRLTLPGYDDPVKRHAWTRAVWVGPARGSMDEEKEARAAKIRIETGISNKQIEAAAWCGEDWDAVWAQRRAEIEEERAVGLARPAPGDSPPDSREAERARERREEQSEEAA